MRVGHALSLLVFWTAASLTGPVAAGSVVASPWLEKFHSKTRLVAGRVVQPEGPARTVVGIHLTLDWGWKTYWRSPGDAGIPPYFDWAGSKNLKRATVLWPAPERFADPAGNSIGYKSEVVLPVVLEAENPAQPVDVRLRLEYAICKDICAPAESEMSLSIAPVGLDKSPFVELISHYMGRVPGRAGEGSAMYPRVRTFSADLASKTPHLTIDAEFAPGSEKQDLFVEGPREIYLPLPKLVETRADGSLRFRVDLEDGKESAALKGQPLTLTLVSDRGQSETQRTVE